MSDSAFTNQFIRVQGGGKEINSKWTENVAKHVRKYGNRIKKPYPEPRLTAAVPLPRPLGLQDLKVSVAEQQ